MAHEQRERSVSWSSCQLRGHPGPSFGTSLLSLVGGLGLEHRDESESEVGDMVRGSVVMHCGLL